MRANATQNDMTLDIKEFLFSWVMIHHHCHINHYHDCFVWAKLLCVCLHCASASTPSFVIGWVGMWLLPRWYTSLHNLHSYIVANMQSSNSWLWVWISTIIPPPGAVNHQVPGKPGKWGRMLYKYWQKVCMCTEFFMYKVAKCNTPASFCPPLSNLSVNHFTHCLVAGHVVCSLLGMCCD